MITRAELFCILVVLALIGACSKKKEDPTPITSAIEPEVKTVSGFFHFQYYFEGKPLQFDSIFTNSRGQKFKFDTISFFLSDLVLIKENGAKVLVNSNPVFENHVTNSSQNLTMKNVPVGDYMGVSFSLGLNSERNKVPTFGSESDFMRYKEKSNGYGFLLISAHLVSEPSTRLKYTIGTNELLRKVSLPLKPFTVFEGQPYFFHYNVDLAPLLHSVNFDTDGYTDSIENKSLALSIADNIPKIFSYGTHH